VAEAANLGFPRLGIGREWKKACEKFWAGGISEEELLQTAAQLKTRHWKLQADAGLDIIPCNDFAFYDQMLDMMRLVGAVPPRFGDGSVGGIPLAVYFAMARGTAFRARQESAGGAAPLEMTKWFDTNYHYLVPEFHPGLHFRLASEHPFQAVLEARSAGVVNARPVLIGPATFLLLGKIVEDGFDRLERLAELTDVYAEVLRRFARLGVGWVQMDEPILTTDLTAEGREIFQRAYQRLTAASDRPRFLLATYFGALEQNAAAALASGVEGLHLDLVGAPSQLYSILDSIPADFHLSLGVVDGRNIWRTDLDKALHLLQSAASRLDPSQIEVAPSCSLLHCPLDVRLETELDPEIREWLAFGVQKLEEVALLTRALNEGETAVSEELEISRSILLKRRISPRVVLPEVRRAQAAVTDSMTQRTSPYPRRTRLQRDRFKLPLLPTTTIGSFPQTDEIRKLRADHRQGRITADQLQQELQAQTAKAIKFQEAAGLDVLVHGEFERADMVEYFAQQMDGFAFTAHGWVQSYGTRAVKPPILFGDVRRRGPMTVEWAKFAQALTSKPVKGMLTGPVTLLKWSFVRDDQPRAETCEQLALAVREEVADLERAGIGIIQIDEPALREGMPLRRRDWGEYLAWAVRCFRLASAGVRDDTQIHTHMCYAEFNEIMDAIADLDADVLSIEASRSRMDLLRSFEQYEYPNEIGPGVWDIHSPRVPSQKEIIALLEKAMLCVPPERLWVNPDCGLKTRKWSEIIPAVKNMVAAARTLRARIMKASERDSRRVA
jgi:5-methyltetrahydropteroyltriglutamate--homocysteine methyltransferase